MYKRQLKTFTVCHWSKNGIHGKVEDLIVLKDDHSPDIIAVTDTKIDQSVPDKLISLPDMKKERRDRNWIRQEMLETRRLTDIGSSFSLVN